MSVAMPIAAPPHAAEVRADAIAFALDHESPAHFGGADAKHNGASEAASPAAQPEQAGRSVTGAGLLREAALPDADRHFAIAMHLSPLTFFWIGPFALGIPLVLWLVRKDQSIFADDHGREVVNFLISFAVLHVILAVTVIGLALLPVLWVVAIVGIIRGAVAAGRSEYFRYPVTMRFLS